jgi:alpha-L-fucosidase
MFNEGKLEYSAEDIRFTVKGGILYAFALAWPASGKLLIRSLAGANAQSVSLLQGGDSLTFKNEPTGLSIQLPPQPRGDHAFTLRIQGVA